MVCGKPIYHGCSYNLDVDFDIYDEFIDLYDNFDFDFDIYDEFLYVYNNFYVNFDIYDEFLYVYDDFNFDDNHSASDLDFT